MLQPAWAPPSAQWPLKLIRYIRFVNSWGRSLPFSFTYVLLITTGFCLLVILQSSLIVDGQVELNLNRILIFVINYFLWAFTVPFIYATVIPRLQQVSWENIVVVLLWGTLLSFLNLVISNALYFLLRWSLGIFDWQTDWQQFEAIVLQAWSSRYVDFLVVLGILKLVAFARDYSGERLKNVELQKNLTEARLQSLLMQLNPHFLFNALHATQTLIGVDDKKARSMVNRISELMRHMLARKDRQFVPFDEEISYIRTYLAVEQERFHDRLTINYEIEERTLQRQVLNLMLQPVVENAIKHGISLLEGAGTITIKATDGESGWSIGVENTFNIEGERTMPSFGIGLTNLKQRLRTAYQGAAHLETRLRDGQFSTRITLPLAHE